MEVISNTLGLSAFRMERAQLLDTLGMGEPSVHITIMEEYIKDALLEGLEEMQSWFFSCVMARKKLSGTSGPCKVRPPASSLVRAGLGGLGDLA